MLISPFSVLGSIPELIRSLEQGVELDKIMTLSYHSSLTIPTPTGLPLSLNLSSVGVTNLKGSIKLDGDIYKILDRQHGEDIIASIDLTPEYVVLYSIYINIFRRSSTQYIL